MGNTWIIDLRAYLTPAGALTANLPVRARLLAEYFASIVVDATTNLDDPPTVQCRRRPGQHDRIHWYYPVCRDNGWITGWQNTFWDGSTEPLSTS